MQSFGSSKNCVLQIHHAHVSCHEFVIYPRGNKHLQYISIEQFCAEKFAFCFKLSVSRCRKKILQPKQNLLIVSFSLLQKNVLKLVCNNFTFFSFIFKVQFCYYLKKFVFAIILVTQFFYINLGYGGDEIGALLWHANFPNSFRIEAHEGSAHILFNENELGSRRIVATAVLLQRMREQPLSN